MAGNRPKPEHRESVTIFFSGKALLWHLSDWMVWILLTHIFLRLLLRSQILWASQICRHSLSQGRLLLCWTDWYVNTPDCTGYFSASIGH